MLTFHFALVFIFIFILFLSHFSLVLFRQSSGSAFLPRFRLIVPCPIKRGYHYKYTCNS